MMDVEQLWSEVLARIQQRIQRASYDTWFKNTKAVEIKDKILMVETSNEFQRDWLDNQYRKQVEELLYELTGETLEASFIIGEKVMMTSSTTAASSQTKYVDVSDLLKRIENLEMRVSELEKK